MRKISTIRSVRQAPKETLLSMTLVGIGVLALIPFLLLSAYVFPVNDDYIFGMRHTGTNPLSATVAGWLTWSGRYLATFLSSLNPIVWVNDPEQIHDAYSGLAIGVIILFVIGWMSATLLCMRKLAVGSRLAIGTLAMLCYLALFPSVSQGFYWFSAYMAYTVPGICYIIFLALSTRSDDISVFLSAVLALLIPGGNEVGAVAMVCTCAYLFAVYPDKKRLVYLILSVIGILVVIASPGNAIRMHHQLSGSPWLWTLIVSVGQTISWFFLWLPLLLVAAIVYLPLGGWILSTHKVFNVSPGNFLLAFVITLILAHVPPTLGLSSVMIDRTANALLFFFIPAFFYGFTVIIRHYREHMQPTVASLSTSGWQWTALFVFIFIGVFSINSPVATATVDLISGKAARYEAIQRKRIEQARQLRDNEECRLPSFGVVSKSLFVKDLEDDPDGEFCQAFAKVYGSKGKVSVSENEPIFEDNLGTMKNYGKSNRQ